jgi:hypothetical protein
MNINLRVEFLATIQQCNGDIQILKHETKTPSFSIETLVSGISAVTKYYLYGIKIETVDFFQARRNNHIRTYRLYILRKLKIQLIEQLVALQLYQKTADAHVKLISEFLGS